MFTMTATLSIPWTSMKPLGLLNHALFEPLISIASGVTQCFIKPKYRSGKPEIMLHSGRTDGSGGHNNRVGGSGAIPYVFQNQNYFSVNIVARALTVWDTMGATLSLLSSVANNSTRLKHCGGVA